MDEYGSVNSYKQMDQDKLIYDINDMNLTVSNYK